MTNILTKPYTNKDYADFVVNANSNGQRTEQDENAVYALYDYEKLEKGQIVNVSSTDNYISKALSRQNTQKKEKLLAQINALDLKSIRAMREASIKDEATGQTWLEYYNEQIKLLRIQIDALQ